MATIVENEKGFKVLKLSQREARRAGMGTIEGVICSQCDDIVQKRIYYVAVINDCMCKKCFEKWLRNSTNYPEDRAIEQRNFDYYYSKCNHEQS